MKIHIVQKGDTIWEIAEQYGVNFEELKELNSHLSSPDMIMPGMKIKIPSTSKQVKTAPKQSVTQKEEKAEKPVQQQALKDEQAGEKGQVNIMPLNALQEPQLGTEQLTVKQPYKLTKEKNQEKTKEKILHEKKRPPQVETKKTPELPQYHMQQLKKEQAKMQTPQEQSIQPQMQAQLPPHAYQLQQPNQVMPHQIQPQMYPLCCYCYHLMQQQQMNYQPYYNKCNHPQMNDTYHFAKYN